MVKELIISASLGPVSELLSQTIESIFETLHAANDVLIQKENFKKFSIYLERVGSGLKELQSQNLDCSESLKNAVEILNREVTASKKLIVDCGNKNKVYLLVNCRRIVESIDRATKDIAQGLNLIPLAALDVSLGIRERIAEIGKIMMESEYSAVKTEEEIMAKIEVGIREGNKDRSYANEVMVRIAEAVGIENLKTEFEGFRKEIEDAKNMAEELQMEQIIALLENSDVVMSNEEKERKYFDTRNSLGMVEPLRPFYCPITLEVMSDPVETASGMTFERHAIERWFATGNRNCPLTLMPLESSVLRPNKNLRRSIEEWKERNNMMTVASIRPKLESGGNEEEVLRSLERLRVLCLEKESHREWVMHENYIPVLVGLLRVKNGEIRRLVLVVLRILTNDGDRNKERISGTEGALEYIVRSLARNVTESKLAVELLRELSGCSAARRAMGGVRGCIFSLVTISMKDDAEAQRLLETLAFVDDNVVQMANANYFRPLLHLLTLGNEDVKLVMAKTLSEIELTERQKLSLFEQGVLVPLLNLLSNEKSETKLVSVKCLQCLSSLPKNGRRMIRGGAVPPLLELLYRHSSSSPSLREHVAATIMHLAESTIQDSDSDSDSSVVLLESEDDVFKLFCLVSLTGPCIQSNILSTLHAMCRSPSGPNIRTKLRQLSAVQVLVQLCAAPNLTVRANATKLFCCLTEDDEEDSCSVSEHVGELCVENLLKILETSTDVEEIAAAMGIISNLPRETRITRWLLEAGALRNIVDALISRGNGNEPIVENAVGALRRFTVSEPHAVAESGIIPNLVQFLVSGTASMKQNAAVCLKQLSESSSALTRPVKKRAVFGLGCCSAPSEAICPAHSGICSVESSFCIVEADAVDPLVKLLRDKEDLGVREAALEALLTLIGGEMLDRGSTVLADAEAIGPIVRLLSSGSGKLQRKSLEALHRLFESAEIKQKFGVSAHMALVEITQRDDAGMKSMAARVLSQLGILQDQSSFF